MDSTCEFQCPVGQRASSGQIKCAESIRGEDNEVEVKLLVPTCDQITCDSKCAADTNCPITFGSMSCTGNHFGAECAYTCDDGFNLMGTPVIGRVII
jgi:hypothetical protein